MVTLRATAEGVYKSTDAGTSFEKLSTTLNLLHWNAVVRVMAAKVSTTSPWRSRQPMPTTSSLVESTFGVPPQTVTPGSLPAHWTGDGAPWVHADHHYFKFHPTQNKLFAAHDGGNCTLYRPRDLVARCE
ncbi:MAG: hypothetical protein IPM83_15050 [Ignavibacteria bacterium]|nr:hypothetical protein [Ignavibacteria bacterium]